MGEQDVVYLDYLGIDVADEQRLSELADFVEVLPDDEIDEVDTTADQRDRGKDVQGIPWAHLNVDRKYYREQRVKQYRNYLNREEDVEACAEQLKQESKQVTTGATFYEFVRNTRAVRSTVKHFQLRHLVWATSPSDVFVMHEDCVKHWNSVTRTTTKVLDLAGGPFGGRAPGLGAVQISTMCAKDELVPTGSSRPWTHQHLDLPLLQVAAGGFSGELVAKDLTTDKLGPCLRVTATEDAITNGIEIFDAPSGSRRIMTSNNDGVVRHFDVASMQQVTRVQCPWPVNYSTVCPTKPSVAAVVGDGQDALLADTDSGRQVATLHGHVDFSFAAAWHPGGHLLATGNQDTTTRVWDVRYLGKGSLAVLKGCMGAVRCLRFSPDGRILAAMEAADFIHLYDCKASWGRSQEVDLFGDLSGITFSPDGEAFFIGVADHTYSSLLQYNRGHDRRPFRHPLFLPS